MGFGATTTMMGFGATTTRSFWRQRLRLRPLMDQLGRLYARGGMYATAGEPGGGEDPGSVQVSICLKTDEFCIKTDEFCIKNDESCITNDEFCI